MAIAILDSYFTTMKPDRERPTFEESEMILYKAMLLEESGQLSNCLQFLQDKETEILDLVAVREKKAEILFKLTRYDEAKSHYKTLIESDPENYNYHRGFQASLLGVSDCQHQTGCELPVHLHMITEDQRAELNEIYDNFLKAKPKVWAFQRIPLDFLVGNQFQHRLENLLRKGLRKGIPSLFSFFKPIYKIALFDPNSIKGLSLNKAPNDSAIEDAKMRVNIIDKTIMNYIEGLKTKSIFPNTGIEEEAEPPTVLLWTLLFAAQHYNQIEEYDQALRIINETLEHTPTLIDAYQVKASILKHMGKPKEASETMEKGRVLDLADRFVNYKATKYLLRADMDVEAEEVVSLFTKHEGDSRANLFEMQCMWYEIEAGNCAKRKEKFPQALKYYCAIIKHFNDFVEDQFDFHSYCLRKVTLRSYIELLRLEDRIRDHEYFARGAHGAICCYMLLHDFPSIFEEKPMNQADLSKMSAAEKKRSKQKARKAAAKAKREDQQKQLEAKKAQEDQTKDGKKRTRKLPVDKDPDGTIAFKEALERPLEKAHELIGYLNPQRLEALLDVFEIQVRRRKYLQALRALYKASKLVKEGIKHPDIHSRLIPFVHYIRTGVITYGPWAAATKDRRDEIKPVTFSVDMNSKVHEVFIEISTELLPDNRSAEEMASEYLKFAKKEAPGSYLEVAALRTLMLIENMEEKRISMFKELNSLQDTFVGKE